MEAGPPRVASQFAGVLCWDLALHAAGAVTAWTSEIDPFCQRIINLRLPGVPNVADIREVDAGAPAAEVVPGGFPCQDLSSAGSGAGLDGERSGLYRELMRVVGILRPKLVLIENVDRLLRLHFERLLYDLRDLGYDCEWDVVPAAAVGAPHLRQRVWVVAYPTGRAPEPIVFGQPVGFLPVVSLDDSEKCLNRKWHRAGMLRGSEVYELEPIAPRRTKREEGWTYWTGVRLDHGEGGVRCWLSPTADPWSKGGGGGELQAQVKTEAPLLPTPTAADARNSRNETAGRSPGSRAHSGSTLSDFRAAGRLGGPLWPTPAAGNFNDGEDVDNWPARRERERAKGRNGNGFGTPLSIAVRLWPTPKANDGDGRSGQAKRLDQGKSNLTDALARTPGPNPDRVSTASLNPPWVEWMMGMPIDWTNPDVPTDAVMLHGFDEEVLPRLAAGVPYRGKRLTAIGNALVWQVGAWIAARALPALDLVEGEHGSLASASAP